MWKAHWTENLITTSLEAFPIQRSDLIDEIENSIKAKNKIAAMLNTSARCPYLDQYLKPGTCVHAQWYRCTHECSWVWFKIHSLKNLKGKRQMAATVKHLYNTLCTFSAHITCKTLKKKTNSYCVRIQPMLSPSQCGLPDKPWVPFQY
jgi:hypothetical protein